jgi:hypothetical protein
MVFVDVSTELRTRRRATAGITALAGLVVLAWHGAPGVVLG